MRSLILATAFVSSMTSISLQARATTTTPDEIAVFAVGKGTGRYDVYIQESFSGVPHSPRVITSGAPLHSQLAPIISPDGSLIAFLGGRPRDAKAEISVINLVGTLVARMPFQPSCDIVHGAKEPSMFGELPAKGNVMLRWADNKKLVAVSEFDPDNLLVVTYDLVPQPQARDRSVSSDTLPFGVSMSRPDPVSGPNNYVPSTSTYVANFGASQVFTKNDKLSITITGPAHFASKAGGVLTVNGKDIPLSHDPYAFVAGPVLSPDQKTLALAIEVGNPTRTILLTRKLDLGAPASPTDFTWTPVPLSGQGVNWRLFFRADIALVLAQDVDGGMRSAFLLSPSGTAPFKLALLNASNSAEVQDPATLCNQHVAQSPLAKALGPVATSASLEKGL